MKHIVLIGGTYGVHAYKLASDSVCLHNYRGDEFRKDHTRLGDVSSILSATVNVMALTATATKTLQEEICTVVKMKNPTIVSVSPDKPNITLYVSPFTTIDKCFGPVT